MPTWKLLRKMAQEGQAGGSEGQRVGAGPAIEKFTHCINVLAQGSQVQTLNLASPLMSMWASPSTSLSLAKGLGKALLQQGIPGVRLCNLLLQRHKKSCKRLWDPTDLGSDPAPIISHVSQFANL